MSTNRLYVATKLKTIGVAILDFEKEEIGLTPEFLTFIKERFNAVSEVYVKSPFIDILPKEYDVIAVMVGILKEWCDNRNIVLEANELPDILMGFCDLTDLIFEITKEGRDFKKKQMREK